MEFIHEDDGISPLTSFHKQCYLWRR